MNYSCSSLDAKLIAEAVVQWGTRLSPEKTGKFEYELNIDGRKLYVLRNEDSGQIEAVFDLQNVLEMHGKNLTIYFSPTVVSSEDGLSYEELESAGFLLVSIFTELISISQGQNLKLVKIHSHDRILLACFSGFATYLTKKGGWKAKAYKNWIELEELSVPA